MKKLLAVLLLITASAQAAYTDYGYTFEEEMADDARLLATASMLYKDGEMSMLKNIKLVCKGIDLKWDKTAYPNSNMKHWKQTADLICAQYE